MCYPVFRIQEPEKIFFAPDLPDYSEYQKKSEQSGAKEDIRRNSGFWILTQ
jgi:hypothetical protein